ncbi:NUDIX domain-containing protein [Tenacibaculum sp. MAR_2009_124]|uniref:NUDIX hydrolase n=1 Tax=Tenacibaculum sp. MAR_2009_124 TaxID=1250059 RepID=UPI0008966E0D|nr:CoA pyrophosphatase [Tenacibaculum sp. MAR_2009_124]SEB50926.1 NUDIX domain-containing protein [Tenacibaculum sp. MAR_2009_124]
MFVRNYESTMFFSDFINQIDHFQERSLGGLNSHFKLAPEIRKKYSEEMILDKKPRRAAVLALFFPDENNHTKFLLTQRASYKGTHSAQISFPGGKYDLNDFDLKETALRETDEEVGVSNEKVNVIRRLSDTYIPPSNFLVAPFMGYLDFKPLFNPNYEVAKIIEVSLDDLLDESNLVYTSLSTSYMDDIEVPSFNLNNYTVWGATAMMLSEIKDLIK